MNPPAPALRGGIGAAADDPWRSALALGATGLLAQFNRHGVLTAADVHVAHRLGRLGGETDERVLLALALAVRGLRGGSVCIDLTEMRSLATGVDTPEVTDSELTWPDKATWPAVVANSPLTGDGRPLRFDLGLLYLDRYWRQEVQVHADLVARESQGPPIVDGNRLIAALDRLFAADAAAQRAAARMAATRWTTVVCGGPGTGKTTTVARLLALLLDQDGPVPRVALAAPTGKAAARLQEAVQRESAALDPADQARLAAAGPLTASTLHRLLGTQPGGGSRFRYHRGHRLPFDVVVVDETSMVSLTLMARLIEAIRDDTRLILVGDPDQLASVEAGAVLADLVAGLRARTELPAEVGMARAAGTTSAPTPASSTPASSTPASFTPASFTPASFTPASFTPASSGPAWSEATAARSAATEAAAAAEGTAVQVPAHHFASSGPVTRTGVVLLDRIWRFDGAVASLAAAVRDGRTDDALGVLTSGSPDVAAGVDGLREDVVGTALAVRDAALAGDAVEALRRLEQHRLLCAHRTGPYGLESWSRRIETWLREQWSAPAPPEAGPERSRPAVGRFGHEGEWYIGRPLLVTANDQSLGLFNGDTGVVITDFDGVTRAVFARGADVVRLAPARLSQVQTVHAMTVHRSQGSQFARVSVVLPPEDSPLLTRELLYTGLTRAREFVRVIGTPDELRAAIARRAARASGLGDRLRRS